MLPSTAFRPNYAGNKKYWFDASQLKRDRLLRLDAPGSVPSVSTLARQTQRVWLDHKLKWSGRQNHPSENLPNYGADISRQVGDAMLYLMLDRDDKEKLLIQTVQIGIDFYGILRNAKKDECCWEANGGHGPGRKGPILFAGFLLDDPGMKGIGEEFPNAEYKHYFQEDCQTFYVTAADKARFPNLFPRVGAPAWGQRHCYKPESDDYRRSYETCCSANSWVGHVLVAHMIDFREAWNHPALFDFQDDYNSKWKDSSHEDADFIRAKSTFTREMWDLYRNHF
jgi:hypothetical protein